MRAGDRVELRVELLGACHRPRILRAWIIPGVLLAADVGNTQSHMGLFEGDELVQHWRFATQVEATADELAVGVSTLLTLRGLEVGTVDGTIVSSVVPQLTPEYQGMSERYLQGECLVLGPGVKTGMPIQLDNPRELGADRLANAVAAYELLGGPCAVADFGTAITFDVVSEAGEYLGGVIGPGGDGAPLAGQRIQIWAHTTEGQEHEPQSHGATLTDKDGKFRLEMPQIIPIFGQPHGHLAYDSGEFQTVFLRPVMRSAKETSLEAHFVLQPA